MKRIALLMLVLAMIGGCPKKHVHLHKHGKSVQIKTRGRSTKPVKHVKHAKHVKHTFWYYPECEVYYSPKTKTYSELVKGQWMSVRTPPTILSTGSGSSHVTIESDTDKPWNKHSHYKSKHPGKKFKGK